MTTGAMVSFKHVWVWESDAPAHGLGSAGKCYSETDRELTKGSVRTGSKIRRHTY